MKLEAWFRQLSHDGRDSASLYRQHVRVGEGVWDAFNLIPVVCLCSTLVAAFCLLPGLRRRRFHTALGLTWCLVTGFGLITAYLTPAWVSVSGAVRCRLAYTLPEPTISQLTLLCGLQGLDVTLAAPAIQLLYWERYSWPISPTAIADIRVDALLRGLPWPMVTALEVLTDEMAPSGTAAGRHLRRAGYMCGWMMTGSIYLWLVGVVLLVTVPRLAARAMLLNGALISTIAVSYLLMLPPVSMHLHFDGVMMNMRLSWCFWMVVPVGILNVLLGTWLVLIELTQGADSFASAFEIGFGTPAYRAGWPQQPFTENNNNPNIEMNEKSLTSSSNQQESSTGIRIRRNTSPWKSPGSIPRRLPQPQRPSLPNISQENTYLNVGTSHEHQAINDNKSTHSTTLSLDQSHLTD